jgi:sugar-specific transcriptional regulator TrmB
MKQIIVSLVVFIACSSFTAHAMTVEEAYAAIPHKRTVFAGNVSKLSTTQIDHLKRLFASSDQGVVLRVEGLRALRSADAAALRKTIGDYRVLASAVASLTVSAEIKHAQDLIAQAIADHQRFFEMKLRDSETLAKRDIAFTADINQASQKLHRAYDVLMKAFPNEPASNKTAFYDYLCALDFL